LLIRWPGHIRRGTRIPQIAGAIDLLPTLADISGVPLTPAKPLDGKSLKRLLLDRTTEWPDRMIFSLQNKRISVRTQQYRLDPEGRLFDMVADLGQDRDVSKDEPEAAARLRKAAADWARHVLPLVARDDRPFPVGYSKITLLPARDGLPEGGIERSSKHPNCSFFTHWTGEDGRMTWDIEVAESGSYDAELYYTCAPADVGSTVELSFLNSTVHAKITEAHDPPLVGAIQDRIARAESYVKDFRPLRMGAIRLTKGRGKLVLRAPDIAGSQVADIRRIALTRNGT
jgi:hypothetical protein